MALMKARWAAGMEGSAPRARNQRADVQIPIAHRRPPAPRLAQIGKQGPDRNRAIAKAHATGAYSYQQIAEHFSMHFTTVGRIVRGDG